MRLLKTSSALPENHVLYNFNTKPTVFKYWREFQSSKAIFGSKTLNNKIWPKRPPDGLKITFCTIFIQSLLFSSIGVNFSPVKRFLDLKRWIMRFGQNVLRMAWKARFVQFSWKAYCFHVLALISVPWAIFGFGTLKNAIWPKRPLAWKARFVQFSWKAYCFHVLAWISVRTAEWNSRQYVKTVGFPWKLYKTCFPGNDEDVLAKSHYKRSKSKIAQGTEINANTWKQ